MEPPRLLMPTERLCRAQPGSVGFAFTLDHCHNIIVLSNAKTALHHVWSLSMAVKAQNDHDTAVCLSLPVLYV